MEEQKILSVTQLQVVDKIQAEDVILLIRDTGNGKQCFQIKGKEITKYKPKPKTQYIIGKAMPIGKLDGGTRLNAYLARHGHFRFKLYNVPQLTELIMREKLPFVKVNELLKGVTWHVFINDKEVYTGAGKAIFGGGVLYIYIRNLGNDNRFYKLDESRSSVDLSSDMYIYLTKLYKGIEQNFTSKTLFLL